MAFAQLAYRESLRDIESCLRSRKDLLYHMGIRGRVSRSTLADANDTRDWRIYGDLAGSMIAAARRLYADEPLDVDLKESVYALDATTIDLCMNLFPWAHFRSTKSAVKLHTLLDLRGNIPSFIHITPGKTHDVNAMDVIPFEPGSFYVMDRGYLDFERLYYIHLDAAFFVIRAKKNLDFIRHSSRETEAGSGVRSDHVGRLGGKVADYPEKLRRVRFYDEKQSRHLVFLTNNMTLPATVIAKLYKMRWQVELFFKWIKQHLRIKSFYGTSSNAVKTQVWIAVTTYVLVAILKKGLRLESSLHRILQVLSVSLFEQTPLNELLAEASHRNTLTQESNQLIFNDF
jgi:transposase